METFWRAIDGKEFENSGDCRRHEHELLLGELKTETFTYDDIVKYLNEDSYYEGEGEVADFQQTMLTVLKRRKDPEFKPIRLAEEKAEQAKREAAKKLKKPIKKGKKVIDEDEDSELE
jgi:hypothetical protein